MAIKTLYFNNLSFTLAAACGEADNFLSIPAEILSRLKAEGLPDITGLTAITHQMKLTLADPKAGTYEVVTVYAFQGEQIYAQRGAEGTAQAWPAGTVMYQALTAGDLSLLYAQFDLLLGRTGGLLPYSPFNGLTFNLKEYANATTVAEWRIPDGEATNIYGADLTINEFESYAWHKLTILVDNAGGARQIKLNTDGKARLMFAPNSGFSMVNGAPTLPMDTGGVYRLLIENVATGVVAISATRLQAAA